MRSPTVGCPGGGKLCWPRLGGREVVTKAQWTDQQTVGPGWAYLERSTHSFARVWRHGSNKNWAKHSLRPAAASESGKFCCLLLLSWERGKLLSSHYFIRWLNFAEQHKTTDYRTPHPRRFIFNISIKSWTLLISFLRVSHRHVLYIHVIFDMCQLLLYLEVGLPSQQYWRDEILSICPCYVVCGYT